MRFKYLTVLFFVTNFFVYSQEDTTVSDTLRPSKYDQKTYTTQRLPKNEAPSIDGIIKESIWDIVPWTGDFIEQMPDENTSPAQETQFKITYDSKYLYVAVRCFDTEPDKIEKRLSRRDGFQGDRVAFILDSYLDKRTAFAFSVTAAGVKGDEFVSENGSYFVDQDRDGSSDFSFSDPDFSFVQFRSNLVMRWEYIPGSELFLVWSQGATGFANPMDGLGFSLRDQILNQKLENTFLIKATYRFAR